ncbi:MAG: hypothetical protein NC342_07320 [Pseudoflavonifractor sp.]|nr:hypothetical protein [Alloprevotella sp.]MCM1117328.1 hypothetical protein [Pseudoflavonifractor sp.]
MTTSTDQIERLFRKCYASSLDMAVSLVHDVEAARDIVHDLFASLLLADNNDINESYLTRALRNSCLNHLRSLSTRDRIHNLYIMVEDECSDNDWPDEDTFELIAS